MVNNLHEIGELYPQHPTTVLTWQERAETETDTAE